MADQENGGGKKGGGTDAGSGEGLPRGACRKMALAALLALLAFAALVSILLFAQGRRARQERDGPTPPPSRTAAPAARGQ